MSEIILKPIRLHWMTEGADSDGDLCAHSPVEFRIGGERLVSPEDGDWIVSASAVYLLRTLSAPHTAAAPVGEHLFPCCGHSMYAGEGEADVLIVGCPNGVNFEVTYAADDVIIREAAGRTWRVSASAWREAVCSFADEVRFFYAKSPPRRPYSDEDTEGFGRLMAEWDRRREAAMRLSLGEAAGE